MLELNTADVSVQKEQHKRAPGRMTACRSQTLQAVIRRGLNLATRRYFFASPTSMMWPSGSRM